MRRLRNNNWIALVAVAFLAATISGCGGSSSPPPISVSVSAATATVLAGATAQVTATVGNVFLGGALRHSFTHHNAQQCARHLYGFTHSATKRFDGDPYSNFDGGCDQKQFHFDYGSHAHGFGLAGQRLGRSNNDSPITATVTASNAAVAYRKCYPARMPLKSATLRG